MMNQRPLLLIIIIPNPMHPHPPQLMPVRHRERQRQTFRRRPALVANQRLGRIIRSYGHANLRQRTPGQGNPIIPRAALVNQQTPGGKPQRQRTGRGRGRGDHIIISQADDISGGGGQRQSGHPRRPQPADRYPYRLVPLVPPVVLRRNRQRSPSAGRPRRNVKSIRRRRKSDHPGSSAGAGR